MKLPIFVACLLAAVFVSTGFAEAFKTITISVDTGSKNLATKEECTKELISFLAGLGSWVSSEEWNERNSLSKSTSSNCSKKRYSYVFGAGGRNDMLSIDVSEDGEMRIAVLVLDRHDYTTNDVESMVDGIVKIVSRYYGSPKVEESRSVGNPMIAE